MKILLTHRYFWPDTAPYAIMLRSMGEALHDENNEIHIFASKPSYRQSTDAPRREKVGNLFVRRCWVFQENRSNPLLRVCNVFLYCFCLFTHILRSRPDVVTASTFPPVIAAWSASLAARLVGAKFIYHMQDIHPEVSRISGGKLGHGLVFKILRWLDNQTLTRSHKIVVLSSDMAETIRRRNIPTLDVVVINNFMLEDFETTTQIPQEYRKPAGIKRAVFAGNLGQYQNLDLLSEGIAACFETHPKLELVFMGDGLMASKLKENWAHNPQVKFFPHLPYSLARQILLESDVGLVSLAPNIYRVAFPSKLLSYLGLGLPVFALVEPESNLAKMLSSQRLGTSPADISKEAIRGAMLELLETQIDATHINEIYSQIFDFKIAFEKWKSTLNSIKSPD